MTFFNDTRSAYGGGFDIDDSVGDDFEFDGSASIIDIDMFITGGDTLDKSVRIRDPPTHDIDVSALFTGGSNSIDSDDDEHESHHCSPVGSPAEERQAVTVFKVGDEPVASADAVNEAVTDFKGGNGYVATDYVFKGRDESVTSADAVNEVVTDFKDGNGYVPYVATDYGGGEFERYSNYAFKGGDEYVPYVDNDDAFKGGDEYVPYVDKDTQYH